MNDADILRVWGTLDNQTYTEARVFACVVAAYEGGGNDFDTRRAREVMQVVWPQNAVLGGVPSEIRGNTANHGNNRNRQADFARLLQRVRRQP